MRPMLFGEALGKVVPLSTHDVAEILEHQTATRRKFGEIALSWNLCRPQHVWQAWWDQLAQQTARVDLTKIGVDAQAVCHLPRELAWRFRVIPLRSFGSQIVIATSEPALPRARAELGKMLNRQVQFVLADAHQVDAAIAAYYPPALTAGAA